MSPLAHKGCLFICSTPIGNLNDITVRALDTLRNVDWIAAEDTRHTRKLLHHYDISTPLISLYEQNELHKSPELVRKLLNGENGALVSDAGTPLLSDPGYHLVREALAADVEVVPVPGASAILAAVVASGLPAYPFYFGGFLPRKQGERRRRLESLQHMEATLVFYEVPHRLQTSLINVADMFPDRQVVVARELTKVHEQFVRGTGMEVAEHFSRHAPRGECVLLIEGALPVKQSVDVDEGRVKAALAAAMATGQSKKEAIKDVASFLMVDRQRVYRIATELKSDRE